MQEIKKKSTRGTVADPIHFLAALLTLLWLTGILAFLL
jgi:hypothetical protein